jgi:Protein of unknown function (DUF4065)
MKNEANLNLTYSVNLPGGQSRLREAALYVMEKCAKADSFGLTKLNKILWWADFKAYAHRKIPVTGRQYQRLKNGPAPFEMLPVLQEMQRDGDVRIEGRPVGNFTEQRPIALSSPSLRYFSADDLKYLDNAISYYWGHTGRGVSKDSHGVAWKTRSDGDPMPYDLALLSDSELDVWEIERITEVARRFNWQSH